MLLWLLRTNVLGRMPVGYAVLGDFGGGPALGPLPVVPPAAAEVALRGEPDQVPLVRDDSGVVLGVVVRVVRRGLLGRRVVRHAAGRAVQLGCAPTGVWRDGVADRTTDRWTWYRHTEDWRLVRGPG